MADHKRNLKNITDYMRVFAIILVVICHCCHLNREISYCGYSVFMSIFLQSIGTLGVAIFFVLAGYFYNAKTYSFLQFWKRKVTTIFIPWIVTALFIYFYGIVRKGGFSLFNLFTEMVGTTSYTWYLSVLCILYLICWPLGKCNKKITICVTALSWVLLMIRSMGFEMWHIRGLGNVVPSHWLPFFMTGMLIKDQDLYERISKKYCEVMYIPLTVIFVLVSLICAIKGTMITYWTSWYFAYAVLGITTIACWSYILHDKCPVFFVKRLGNISFSLYLLHMPVAGIMAYVFNKFAISPVLIRPILVIVVTYVGIIILRIIARKVDLVRPVDICIGYRER